MKMRMVLTGVFGAAVILIGQDVVIARLASLSLLQLIMVALAIFRLARMVSFDTVMCWLREPFAETIQDPTGAGMTTCPKGGGWRRIVGELLTCPICVGTWLTLGILAAISSPLGNALLLGTYVFGIMGAVEILQAVFECVQWKGELSRNQTGALIRKVSNLSVESEGKNNEV